MNANRISTLALLLMPALASAAQAAPSLRVSPLGYLVTQVQAVPGQHRTYDVTSRVGITNTGDPARNVTATLTSRSASFLVIDGVVQAGEVPRTSPWLPYRSPDTFTIRVTVPRIMNLGQLLAFMRNLHESLVWQVSCANCGQANRPPLANAGADQSVYVQQRVTLDGAASSDPDGDALSFEWTVLQRPAGSTAALGAAASVRPTLTPDREGEYLLQLIVRDGQLASAPDTVTISTRNSAPVASAGPDRTIQIGLPVQLDGSGSSDVDGDPLTYAWQLVQRPAGSAAMLERPDEVNPSFTPDLAGQYVVELVVDDGTVSSAPDTAVLSTANSRPVANAGADQTAAVGATVQLDGSGSGDPDGDTLGYQWSLATRPAGSAAALQGANTVLPSLTIDRAGTYVVQLIVNDGISVSEADTVSISTQNSVPVAIIDGPDSVHFGATVPLTGLRSSDPDGDPLSFNWSLLSTPQGSSAALNEPFAIAPQFLADLPGTYVAQLIVGDGITNSSPASLSILAQNAAPVVRDDEATTTAGTPVTVAVLANDSDPDPEDSLRVLAVGAAAHGSVTHTMGDVTYTPEAGYSGADQFTYEASDGAASASATVRVTVTAAPPQNRPPVANAGADQSVPGGSAVTLSGALSGDPDGDPLAYHWTLVSRPTGSVAAIQDATSVSAGFTADLRGSYEVRLTVNDGRGGESADTVLVTAQNRNPVALDDAATATAGQPVTIDVLANDSDADNDVLSITSVEQPAAGLAQIVGTSVRFTPAGTGGSSTDFAYTISDGNGGSAGAQVVVTISAALPSLSIHDISAGEGDEGTHTESFLVMLSAPSASATTAQFTTVPGTATSPADFVARSGTVSIPAGQTSAEVEITIVGDTLHEGNESFRVALSNPQNATIGVGEGEAVIVDDDAGGPTRFDLIDAALAAGTIDAETALLYKVYAEFSDSRLPSDYQVGEPPGWEGHAIREAARRFATLTPATQALIAPFLEFPDLFAAPAPTQQLPTAARSRMAVSAARRMPVVTDDITNYVAIDLVPGLVRIGWDADSPLAAAMEMKAAELKLEFDETIWPRLTEAFGALGDGSRILILLDVRSGPSYEDSADCNLARIWLRRYESYTFAHELTHALLDLNFSNSACNQDEKLWMHEATATWAQHHVYPEENEGFEHHTAPLFLRHPERSLDTHDRTTRSPAYGAYLWFLRMAGRDDNSAVVRDTWNSSGGVTSLAGIDAELRSLGRGGFEKDWPLFAADNWNRHAPHRKYYEWDRMNHKPPQEEVEARLAGNGWEQVLLQFDLPRLSAKYLRVNFESDPDIRTVLFMNGDPARSDKARVHAIVKIRGQDWKEAEDWTRAEEKAYCRDVEDQDVEEIVFVLTNVGFGEDGGAVQDAGNYSLIYSGLPCDDWTGSTTWREERRAGGAVEISTAVGSGLRLRADPNANRAIWRAIEGSLSYQYESTSPFEDGSCESHASTTLSASQGAQIALLPSGNGLDLLGTTILTLPNPPTLFVTTTCTSSSGTFTVQQDVPWFGATWFYTGPDLRSVENNPESLQDEYSSNEGGAESRWTWSFMRAPQN
jgi:hypothetical protein